MASVIGKNISVTIFGQSHSKAIGVSIDGLPAGEEVDLEELQKFLDRRAPGRNEYSTTRFEKDELEVLCGLIDGRTCGAPFAAIIRNQDAKSENYKNYRDIPRPGHADFPAHMKYGGYEDVAGSGHFSGRLTAPLCIAGGVIKQILERRGIDVSAKIEQIGGNSEAPFDEIESAKADNDSVGGIIKCRITGVPAGLGDPMFDGLENKISQVVFGIPAVKGVEFGDGFRVAEMRGSENNDSYYFEGDEVRTKTNHSGGILGGISTGMPIIFRVAVKPTSSIGKEQTSISYSTKGNVFLSIRGRHDPCIVPRAVPVVEAAAAVAIADFVL